MTEDKIKSIKNEIDYSLRKIDSEKNYKPEFMDEEYILGLETNIEQLKEML